MNANNQQTSVKTHWVNTKTIAETIDLLYEANHKALILWNEAKGYDDLKKELFDAFDYTTKAIKAMKEARIVNSLKRKEE